MHHITYLCASCPYLICAIAEVCIPEINIYSSLQSNMKQQKLDKMGQKKGFPISFFWYFLCFGVRTLVFRADCKVSCPICPGCASLPPEVLSSLEAAPRACMLVSVNLSFPIVWLCFIKDEPAFHLEHLIELKKSPEMCSSQLPEISWHEISRWCQHVPPSCVCCFVTTKNYRYYMII